MCCCCEKRTGHLVVVSLMLIYYALSVVGSVAVLGSASAFIAGLVLGIVGICLCVLDLYGINKNNASYMTPFLVWMILSTIFAGIAAGILIIMLIIILASHENDPVTVNVSFMYGAAIAAVVLSCILNGYFSYVISSHKKEVETEQGYDRMKTQVNIMVTR